LVRGQVQLREKGMRRAVIAAVIATLLLAGWAATGSVIAQVPGCLPTSARTLGPHAFPGLRRRPANPVYTDAYQYALTYLAPANANAEADRLNSWGFVSATWQTYVGIKRKARGHYGYTVTEQMGSPEQAQADFDRWLAQALKPRRAKPFSVVSIPGARGVRETPNKRQRSAYSFVYFTEGDYYYNVGSEVRSGGGGTAQAIHAATDLYNSVNGAPACP
jgi:hypothetical protein